MNGEHRTSEYFDWSVRRDAIPGLDMASVRRLFRGGGRFKRIPLSTRFVATQPTVTDWIVDLYVADPFARPGLSPFQDPYPVLVDIGGRLHIADGHHRIVGAIQRGDAHIDAWVASFGNGQEPP